MAIPRSGWRTSRVARRYDHGGWGAHEKGWPEVQARYEWAGARFRDSGAKLSVEYLTSVQSGDLAFTTAIERAEVKVAGQEKAAPMALRVTHIFRKEDGAWKLVLRHADPLAAKTAPDPCWRSDRHDAGFLKGLRSTRDSDASEGA